MGTGTERADQYIPNETDGVIPSRCGWTGVLSNRQPGREP